MGNVFPIDKPIHERYDLKGSTRNRSTTEAERQDPNVVLKDLDWINSGRKLHLGPDKKRRLLAQIKKDCALLESMEVIDYSLLIGIHRASISRNLSRERVPSMFYKVSSGQQSGRLSSSSSSTFNAGLPRQPFSAEVAASIIDAKNLQRSSVKILDTVSQQQLHREHMSKVPGVSDRQRSASDDGEPEVGKEVYFVGLIDMLCEYGLKKQLEHHYKAAKHGEKVGAQNFSVVDPTQYSTRFQNFIADALD